MDVSRLLQLGDDPYGRAFCNADRDSDVSHPHLWIVSEADNDVAVVAQKGPAACGFDGLPLVLIGWVSLLFSVGA